MIAVIDYGVGNMFSLCRSLERVGAESVVTSDFDKISMADKLILPGVGAFGDASKLIKQNGMDKFIKEQCAEGKPLLGICLGMQLLFDKSYEYGAHEGLGLIEGEIVPLADYVKGFKIPHMGWNRLKIVDNNPILRDLKQGSYVYFVHSYYAKCKKGVSATTDYGIDITAAVRNENIFGVQFHPEKSGENGLSILKAFNEL